MLDPFIGEIYPVPYNFAPRHHAFCQGQILSISQNTALFSILGTTYGGNGQTTFALPDLRGRVPIGQGQGPGLSSYVLGESAGVETVTLTTSEMAAHSHSVAASSSVATGNSPTGGKFAAPAVNERIDDLYATSSNANLSVASIGVAGNNFPHNNLQPYLTVNWIIAINGVFPPRN